MFVGVGDVCEVLADSTDIPHTPERTPLFVTETTK